MCRGGGSRAQGLVRAGVVPTTPRSFEKIPARDESSFGCVVQTRQFMFVFSLRFVGFSRSSVLKFPFKGSWRERVASVPERLTPPWRVSPGVVLVGVCPRGHLGRTIRGRFLGLRLLL